MASLFRSVSFRAGERKLKSIFVVYEVKVLEKKKPSRHSPV
jgi:hypothetical protein